ncbi:hypothetical protein HID58_004980, partial [Brassica napus]
VKTLLISQFASSSASSWGKYGDQSSSYHTPSHPSASPAPSYNPHGNLRRILRAHGWVIHRSMRFESHKLLCLFTSALSHTGLESSNLIVGIDVTKSNEWTEPAIHWEQLQTLIIKLYRLTMKILNSIKVGFFGFDFAATTHDVFSFNSNNTYFVTGLKFSSEILTSSCALQSDIFCTHHRKIHEIVEENGGQYHVLLIISDGQIKKAVLELELKFGYKQSHTFIELLYGDSHTLLTIFTLSTSSSKLATFQLHFSELKTCRCKNVKKGGQLMGLEMLLLDAKYVVIDVFKMLSEGLNIRATLLHEKLVIAVVEPKVMVVTNMNPKLVGGGDNNIGDDMPGAETVSSNSVMHYEHVSGGFTAEGAQLEEEGHTGKQPRQA